MTATEYLGVYKALYAYEAQGEDEVNMEEDQLVFVLDNSDEDWVKIKIKTSSQELDGPEGLVPAAYIEKAQPIGTVKAAYDYEATAQGELSIEEGQVLHIHERDEEWILVESTVNGKTHIGYVPANYVEEGDGSTESEQPAAPPPAVVVPDSPPRAAYIAPEERTAAVAASADKSKQDKIETWAVSQLDKKGKKKKGTLGVGGGAIFFASESDKTPVQKWQTSDITGAIVDKSKHIQVDFKNSESLRFLSKDAADAIHRKIESSRQLAEGGGSSPRPSADSRSILDTPRAMEIVSPPKASEPKSVHFAVAPETIPNQDYDEGDGEEGDNSMQGETAVALYDFTGDATDELSVKEGETVLVLDRSNDDWWKCQNHDGQEGVIPAQYLDLENSDGEQDNRNASSTASASAAAAAAAGAASVAASRAVRAPSPEEDSEEERERAVEEERLAQEKERERQIERAREKERARAERAEREAEERKARAEEEERLAAERKRAEEKKARAAAAAQQQKREAEAQQKKEAEKRAAKSRKIKKRQDDEEEEEEEEDDALAEAAHKMTIRRAVDRDNEAQNTSRPNSGIGRHGPPPTGKTRIWHDRTGQFRVEAEYKGLENGKIRLHKLNGVTIEVPLEKMSQEDVAYLDKLAGNRTSKSRSAGSRDEDDEPLAKLAKPAQPTPAPSRSPRPNQDAKPKKRVDWFDFFLNAGCEMDDCTRYAQAFERDKIDEAILPDLKGDTLRTLGFREGDIIRVLKAIEKKHWRSSSLSDQPGVQEQIRADELYAQQVQEALLAGKKPPPPPGPLPQPKRTEPAPNLFAGPGGVLKDNTRRGRPTPAKSASMNVDENALANASSQLKVNSPVSTTARTPSPNLIDASNASTTSSTASKPSGFDDDAWTPRPSSTNPISPVVAVTPPAAPASAPPAPAPLIPAPAQPAASISPPPRPSTTDPATAALSKELELLQKIAELKRPPSAPVPYQAPAPPPVPSPAAPTASFLSTLQTQPGQSFGSLQAQQTGFYAGTPPPSSVRGPFAPVPQNEAILLKPLVPTTTGFTGFVPTKTGGAPQLFSQPTGYGMQTSPFQATSLQPIQTSPFQPQPTGFVGLAPQPTGFMGPSPIMSQATGLPFGFRSTPSPIPPMPPMPPQFTAAPSFNQSNFNQQSPFANPPITTQPFGSMSFGNSPSASSPPPDHSPANVFASMKSGNFGGDEHAGPSPANYDALRNNPGTNPLISQPTGWIPSSMQPGYPYR